MNLQEAVQKAEKEWQNNPRKAQEEKEVIAKYGAIFNPKNIDNLTAENFKSFLKYENNKHWDGIFVHGINIADDMPKLKKTLKILLDESIPIGERIKRIRDPSSSDYHKRFGTAYYTPILLVVYPEKHPVVNGVVRDALDKTGIYPNYTSKPEWFAYPEAREKILELAKKINFSLWKMDWLWWKFYERLDFTELHKFITKTMDPKTNYQPVMIKTLLDISAATKDAIDEQIILHNPDKDPHFTSKEVYEVLVDKHKIVTNDDDVFKLNLIEELTPQQKTELINLCNQKIESFKRPKQLSSETQYFLVQVMEKGSKEFLKKGAYEHPAWQNDKRAADRGRVKPGDILVAYFGGGSIDFKKTLKMIYKVDSIADNHRRFNVSIYKELKGIPYAVIKKSRQNGKLSTIFNQLGLEKFNIIKITRSDYDAVLSLDGSQVINQDDERFDTGHKLFKIELSQKDHHQPFEDFKHPDLLEDEINYKIKALNESIQQLSLDRWDEWKSEPEKICNAVRDATAFKISQNLVWTPPYHTEKGYFDEIDDKSELAKQLYDFFKVGSSEPQNLGPKFDNLVAYLEKINKVEWRFLAYLLFLRDPTRYFPVHPSNFDKLLEFYGISVSKEKNWKKYSLYLKLADELKSRLLKIIPETDLSAIQIQSYMYVIAKAVSKDYWMIRAGTDGSDWENQRKGGVIGIHYYTLDLSKFTRQDKQLSKPKVIEKIQEIRVNRGEEPGSKAELDADYGQLEDFFSIGKGDKIIAIGNNSTLLGVGDAQDGYQFRTDISENCHTVPVAWYDVNERTMPLQTMRRTLKKLDIKDYVDLMMPTQVTTETSEYNDILLKKLQIIFYGPPGTGKTFTANNLAKWFVSTNKTKANSEDLRSMTDDQFNDHVMDEIRKFAELQNYEFIKDAGTFNLYTLRSPHNEIRLGFVFSKSGKQHPEDVYLGISQKMIDFLSEVPIENQFIVIINNDVKNFVVLPYEIEQKYARFVTGEESGKWDNSGKTQHAFRISISPTEAKLLTRGGSYSEKYYDCTPFLGSLDALGIGDYQENIEFVRKVTFHPSYSYEEFVEGIKPKTRGNYVEYLIEDGAFKKICNDARNDPENRYVLIIDEINRGNISKIFGELITLIENDKRDNYSLHLTYSHKPFTVPKNLYIIGSMNTADRSLTQLDVALRRRFGFCELMPDYDLIKVTIDNIPLDKLLQNLNKKIREYEGREKQIGHSYFMNDGKPIETLPELQFIFVNEIIPLLQDYFYEDYEKLQQVLGTDFVDAKNMEIKSEWKTDKDIFKNALRPFIENE